MRLLVDATAGRIGAGATGDARVRNRIARAYRRRHVEDSQRWLLCWGRICSILPVSQRVSVCLAAAVLPLYRAPSIIAFASLPAPFAAVALARTLVLLSLYFPSDLIASLAILGCSCCLHTLFFPSVDQQQRQKRGGVSESHSSTKPHLHYCTTRTCKSSRPANQNATHGRLCIGFARPQRAFAQQQALPPGLASTHHPPPPPTPPTNRQSFVRTVVQSLPPLRRLRQYHPPTTHSLSRFDHACSARVLDNRQHPSQGRC